MRSIFIGGTIRTVADDSSPEWVLVEDDVIAAIGTGEPPSADENRRVNWIDHFPDARPMTGLLTKS